MSSKNLTIEEVRKHLSAFANAAYDTSEWTQEQMHDIEEMVGDFTDYLFLAKHEGIENYEAAMVMSIYQIFGMKPRKFDEDLQWKFWVVACNVGNDDLAFRLLMDEFNPKERKRGFHSARQYAAKNRLNLPKTWSYFCQEDLAKKAAKVRKRSWAGGTYTERAM